MTEIPMPEVLNPERVDASGAGPPERHHQLVAEALYQACEYGRALWVELELTRRYLLEQVARGSQGGPVMAETQPLLRSEQDWESWAARYGAIFSRLCGPNGDEDLGKREALQEAQARHHLLPAS